MTRILLACCIATSCLSASAAGQAAAAASAPASQPQSIEDEVFADLQGQAIGGHTLRDYHLPEVVLRRIADRLIRASFEKHFRIVVRDDGHAAASQPASAPPSSAPASRTPAASADSGAARVVHVSLDEHERLRWSVLTEGKPALRAMRLQPCERGPQALPPTSAPAPLSQAADLVARRLATDGLLYTLAQTIAALGPARFERVGTAELLELSTIGVPVDLLRFFDADQSDDAAVVRRIASHLAAGATPASLRKELSAMPFHYRSTRAGFQLASESGEHEIGSIRLQITRRDDWLAPGDGGAVDIARQLLKVLPSTPFVVGIAEENVDGFLATLRGGGVPGLGRLTLIAQSLPLAQWAQDNGKPGFVMSGSAAPSLAILAPRFASRGEDGSTFVPGENLALKGLCQAGYDVIASPLLFQGGDLIVVREPATQRRVLLVGEAEIHRNVALGLTGEQVTAAFQSEFGVDRVIVLPAVSFHIDYEVSARAVGPRVVAFVNDPGAAARIILRCGLSALRDAGVLSAGEATTIAEQLSAGQIAQALDGVGRKLIAQAVGTGAFPESLSKHFSLSPGDSGVGNLQTFLLALDVLSTELLGPAEMPQSRMGGYYRALRRQSDDRAKLHAQLAELGWKVVPVASLAEPERGLNYVNGIQVTGRYFMPAAGGLYEPLDKVAAATFQRELGNETKVTPIGCAESQRRAGAIRCATSVYPKPPASPNRER